jgi:hypothetical protein
MKSKCDDLQQKINFGQDKQTNYSSAKIINFQTKDSMIRHNISINILRNTKSF